jgi:putative hydrolase of the HAD superfamily
VIRAVICDFGGVLTSPLAGSFQAFSEHSGIPLAALGTAFAAIHERDGVHPLHELECGRAAEADFLADVAGQLAKQLEREIAMDDFSERYFAGLSPNAPMIELMAALRAEGYRMALLTNNVREWEPLWRAMVPIDEIFELVVDSAFVGMRKPDRGIYDLIVDRLGVPAAECLFVDDAEANCVAAREAGMRAVAYRHAGQAIAEIRAALQVARGALLTPGEPALSPDADQLEEPSRSQR